MPALYVLATLLAVALCALAALGAYAARLYARDRKARERYERRRAFVTDDDAAGAMHTLYRYARDRGLDRHTLHLTEEGERRWRVTVEADPLPGEPYPFSLTGSRDALAAVRLALEDERRRGISSGLA